MEQLAGLGFQIERTELEPLMYLDCALRQDIPGADGWLPDPKWFRDVADRRKP